MGTSIEHLMTRLSKNKKGDKMAISAILSAFKARPLADNFRYFMLDLKRLANLPKMT